LTQAASGRVLVVGPAWIGDMVMAQTLFKLLKQRQADVVIDVLAPRWTFPLLERMPEVTQRWQAPFQHGKLALGKRWSSAKQLRQGDYAQAIILPHSFKSALVPFWAGIKRRTGWRGECRWGVLNDVRHLDAQRHPLMIQRFMALGLAPDEPLPHEQPLWPRLETDAQQVRAVAAQYQLELTKPVLALCPGAEFGATKRWPAEYYAEVAKQKLAEHWQVWLLGSAKELPVTEQIQHATDQQCITLAGKTSLAHAIDLLSLAQCVVSNDSGLMHIAAALQRPLVVIYGSTSPHFTPPLSTQMQVLTPTIECSPCFKRHCPLKHFRCMLDQTPDGVLGAIDSVVC